MSSLNDGFELDEELKVKKEETDESLLPVAGDTTIRKLPASEFTETVFEDPIVEGEVPELNDDTSLITVVDQAKDLQYLRTDIVRANGMDKRLALEAERLMPGFVNQDRPIGFFTEFPSKTNYKAVLEAIQEETKSLARRVWDAIVQFMKQAADWIVKFAKDFAESLSRASKAQDVFDNEKMLVALEMVQRSYVDPASVIRKVDMLLSDKTSDKAKAYKAQLEENLKAGGENVGKLYSFIHKNDAVYAVAAKNTAVGTLLEILEKSSDFSLTLSNKIDAYWLNNVLRADKSFADKAIRDVFAPAASMKFISFDTYSRSVDLSLKQRTSEYSFENMPLAKLFKTFNETFKSRDMKRLTQSINQTSERIRNLQSVIFQFTNSPEWISKEKEAEKQTNDVSHLAEVVRVLHRELRALLHLVKLGGDVNNAWIWMGNSLDSVQRHFERITMLHTAELPSVDREKLRKYFFVAPRKAED